MNTLIYEAVSQRIGKGKVSEIFPKLQQIAKEWKLNLKNPKDVAVAKRILIDNDCRLIVERNINLN